MFIAQFEHILEASWDQFNQHIVKELYVKARQIPKGGNSHKSTLAWTKRVSSSPVRLWNLNRSSQWIRRIHLCRRSGWVEILGRVSRNVIRVLIGGRHSHT